MKEWSLPLVLEATFSRDSIRSLVVLLRWKFSISKVRILGATISWYQKTSFPVRVQTWPHKGSTSIVMTIRSIEWILMLVHISSSPFSMLILTSYCSATSKVTRPSRSIMWNYLPWPVESTSPLSCCNASFICFLIFLVNIVVISHKWKWFTCTINILYMP